MLLRHKQHFALMKFSKETPDPEKIHCWSQFNLRSSALAPRSCYKLFILKISASGTVF